MFSGWQKAGILAGGAVAAAAATIIGESVKAASAYQDSTTVLQTQAGISARAAQQVGDAFLSTAGKTTFSAQEIMDAYGPISGEFVTMTGHALNARQSLEFMSQATDLALASNTNLTGATKVLANVMLAYHVPLKKVSDATNTLYNVSRLTGLQVPQLGMQMTMLRSRIQGANLSVQDMGGFMVEMASKIGNGRMAVRLAGTTIQQLVTPSTGAKKALEALGISFTNAQGKFIGMPAALDRLKMALGQLPPVLSQTATGLNSTTTASKSNVKQSAAYIAIQGQIIALHTQKSNPALQQQIRNLKGEEQQMVLSTRATGGHAKATKNLAATLDQATLMQTLFGRNAKTMQSIVDGGSAAFKKNAAAVDKANSAHKAAEAREKTFSEQIKMVKAAMHDMMIEIGQIVLPILTQLMQKVTPIIRTFAEWVTKHRQLVVVIVAVAGAIGAFVVAALALAKAFHIWAEASQAVQKAMEVLDVVMDANPVFLVIAAIIALGVAFYEMYEHVTWFRNAVNAAWSWIKNTTITIWNAIRDFFVKWWPLILGVMTGGIGLIVYGIIKYWGTIKDTTVQIWNDIKQWLTDVWNDIVNVVTGAVSDVWQWIQDGWNDVVNATTGTWNRVISFIKHAWDSIISGVSSAITSVISFFTGLPGRILGALGNLATLLLNDGWNLIVGLLQGIYNFENTLWGWFVNFPSTLWGYFKSADQWLVNIGKNIIIGLINGIGSMMSGIPKMIKSGLDQIPVVGSLASKLTGGLLAMGGTATKGLAYIVGEKGPELFIPDETGTVVPNNALTQGTNAPTHHRLGGGSGGATYQTIIDMTGTYLLSNAAMDDFLDKVEARLVHDRLPAAGLVIRK